MSSLTRTSLGVWVGLFRGNMGAPFTPQQVFVALGQLFLQRSGFTEVLNWESVVCITGRWLQLPFEKMTSVHVN